MSVRQDALKRQYETRTAGGAAPSRAPRGLDGNGRSIRRVPLRNILWRWFWLLFLLTLLGGFLYGRKDIAKWYHDRFEPNGEITAIGRLLGTQSLVTFDMEKHTHQAITSPNDVGTDVIAAYLTPSGAEMDQIYSYVVNAPFVSENLQYRDRLKGLPFVYIPTNDIVNAAAGRRAVEKDGETGIAFHTVFFGGAARYARLVGLAAALQDAGHKDMLKKFVAAMPLSFCSRCSEEECAKFILDNGLAPAFADEKIRQRALSYSSGTIAYVIAHECGHHALGHLLSFSEKANLEISRNQEREADSFASSVISASPFGEYIFAGTLFWSYAMAKQSDGASDSGNSHPLWQERFENLVRANAEKAAAMGITLKK